MQINSSFSNINQQNINKTKQNENKFENLDTTMNAKQISNSYFLQYSQQIEQTSSSNINAQSSIFGISNINIPDNLAEILKDMDLDKIGYNGKNITELSKEEADELVGENGFFGISQTSERITNFIINGAGDDVEKLRAGKEGMLRGFKEAEKLWGSKLPEISQKTIEKSIQEIDKKLAVLGADVLNVSA
ncbi:hydrogenase-4 component G [Campylobacter pinnipediorum]|uniref:Hydrogenase-4 component G n=1 Tax=Campylobacter pinnipediorum subsp. pinnipediorum TaxID=1660067 RepID=A0AAX0LBN7_9BACT|nr:hydrogenase-4 component G [Campylobacter pinnipediorum]AQW81531.1 hypothetical protein CPIN17260_1245 [Campylobacter pinnipediorum subsp. pinnipediorum]AQW83159.1 hypothetical protein CPIN17261_1158 [Campylobacter pinnipediorum subsp. pinnipediorum]OPA81804.1 hydrogenase-4 component G [Campylobacter pinnipediorum subsp. pinnipediorum]